MADPNVSTILRDHVPAERIVIGHLDNVIDLDLQLRVLDQGAFVECDGVGQSYFSEAMRVHFPSDDERAAALAELIDAATRASCCWDRMSAVGATFAAMVGWVTATC